AKCPVLITSPQYTASEVEAGVCCDPRITFTTGRTAVSFPACCAGAACPVCATTSAGIASSKQIVSAIRHVSGCRAFMFLIPPRAILWPQASVQSFPVHGNPQGKYQSL